jgi:membrane fusion protein (multidrug efflux system)
MFVEVSISTEERASVPVVPREALILKEGKQSVYVVGGDNKATLRPVQVGLTAERVAEILDGIRPGERVVVIGLDDLRDGQIVAPTPFTAPALIGGR